MFRDLLTTARVRGQITSRVVTHPDLQRPNEKPPNAAKLLKIIQKF